MKQSEGRKAPREPQVSEFAQRIGWVRGGPPQRIGWVRVNPLQSSLGQVCSVLCFSISLPFSKCLQISLHSALSINEPGKEASL